MTLVLAHPSQFKFSALRHLKVFHAPMKHDAATHRRGRSSLPSPDDRQRRAVVNLRAQEVRNHPAGVVVAKS